MERIYLKPGDTIGCSGYTDLKITQESGGDFVNGLVLQSTEGGELDFYDEENDAHYPVYYDMDKTPKTNKNYGRFYYEK